MIKGCLTEGAGSRERMTLLGSYFSRAWGHCDGGGWEMRTPESESSLLRAPELGGHVPS